MQTQTQRLNGYTTSCPPRDEKVQRTETEAVRRGVQRLEDEATLDQWHSGLERNAKGVRRIRGELEMYNDGKLKELPPQILECLGHVGASPAQSQPTGDMLLSSCVPGGAFRGPCSLASSRGPLYYRSRASRDI